MKKVLLLILICCFFMPIQVLGHSYVGSSFPSEGDVVEEPLEQIELQFDTGIEEHTSIELIDEAGDVVPLRGQMVEGRTLSTLLEQPLFSGNYTIHWTALGSDGHTTEGTISFSVDATEPEVFVEEEEDVGEVDEGIVVEEEHVEPDESVQEEQKQEEEATSNLVLFLIIGLVVIVSIFIVVRRRK